MLIFKSCKHGLEHKPGRVMKIALLGLCFLSLCCASFAQPALHVQVQALQDSRAIETVFEAPFTLDSVYAAAGLTLQPGPGLLDDRPGDPRESVALLASARAANGVHALQPLSLTSPFQFHEENGRLILQESGQPVWAYAFAPQLPEGVAEKYRRADYFHPLYDLDGRILTDDFPKDHYHHRGLSWMWPHVRVAGQEYNLWESDGHIRQVFENWLCRETGPVAAVAGMQSSWQVQDHRVCDEKVWVRVFRSSEHGRVIDLRIVLTPREPIGLLGAANKGYGGLSLRFAPRDCTLITSPQGDEGEDSNDQLFTWTDLSARFEGADDFSGITVLQHLGNPDAPAEWCIRHYGFLGVSWPGLHPVTLQSGQPVTFRFRLWLHRGSGPKAFLSTVYHDFTQPPQIRLIKK